MEAPAMKRLSQYKRRLARMLKRDRRDGVLTPEARRLAKKIINAEPEPNEDLPDREWLTPNEIWRSRFRRQVAVYTKCNPALGESVESSNYREIWGMMVSPNRMKVKIFSVIRDGVIKDRTISASVEGVRTITLRKTDRLILVGMKRYPNP